MSATCSECKSREAGSREEPQRARRGRIHSRARSPRLGYRSSHGGGSLPMVQLFDRVVVAVDVERFSRARVRRQLLIQEQLDRMLTEAASAARLDRSEWDRRGDGDGEVAVLPGDVDLLLIVRR